MRNLKEIYKALSQEVAENKLEEFAQKWPKKYPSCINSWENNWVHLSAYFKYPKEIRTIIYTTNAIENFNRKLQKVTKSKSIFPADAALTKSFYLAMIDATSKWISHIRNWNHILNHLAIYFEERIVP